MNFAGNFITFEIIENYSPPVLWIILRNLIPQYKNTINFPLPLKFSRSKFRNWQAKSNLCVLCKWKLTTDIWNQNRVAISPYKARWEKVWRQVENIITRLQAQRKPASMRTALLKMPTAGQTVLEVSGERLIMNGLLIETFW